MKNKITIFVMVSILILGSLGFSQTASALNGGADIAEGFDLFETRTPTDFAGELFEGVPLGSFDFGGGPVDTGSTDTIVQRLGPGGVPGFPETATIDIELVALSLRSIEPIDLGCGVDDYFIGLGSSPSLGAIFPTFNDPNGGTFDIVLTIFFDLRTGAPDGPVCAGDVLILQAEGVPWNRTSPPDAVLIDGVNHLLSGVDNTQDFWPSPFTSQTPPESFVSAQHTVAPALEIPPPPPSPGNPDHYLAYRATETPDTPTFSSLNVQLSDQFESATYTVARPFLLFNPVDKNLEGIADMVTHFVGYIIWGPHQTQTNVLVSNQFGEIQVDTIRPIFLMVPSSKNLDTEPPELGEITVDHYKCYVVAVTPDTPAFVPIQVQVSDPNFEEDRTFDVKRPRLLCNPVDKNGEGIIDVDTHQVCYDVRPAIGQPPHVTRSVFTNNQFGAEQLDTQGERLLCVPSTKILDAVE